MTERTGADLVLHDVGPGRALFHDDVLAGLIKKPKELPCKYFYDDRGSELFEQICALEDYYPTRSELTIMERYGAEMAAAIGEDSLLIEYGSGSSRKTRRLLEQLPRPAAYVPVDISRNHLLRSAASLSARFPDVPVKPVCADFTKPFPLPELERPARRCVVYFPGSTIGNLGPGEARKFLAQIAGQCGARGGLLIGVDLEKDRATLERAYDDREGVTARFNLNLLARINRELGADFALDRFVHRAFYNAEEKRVEMHLVSTEPQRVTLGETEIHFERDETIHTENSYKYRLEDFAELARGAGFEVGQVWTDDPPLFSVQYFAVD